LAAWLARPYTGKIMSKNSKIKTALRTAIAGAALFATTSANAALVFNFTFLPTSTAEANAAFVQAGQRWSNLFTDNVTINLTVGQVSLGTGILAQAGSSRSSFSYAQTVAAMTADATSADDATAVSFLPTGSVGMLINRTADNPNGAGSATTYVDNNNSANNNTIRMTNANAKALGLTPTAGNGGGLCTTSCDAGIQFATAFTWDFDPSDGITAGSFDFVGIATHEIGHALGFISGIDVLDGNSTGTFFGSDQFTFVNTLDLFRFSTDSVNAAGGAVIDWSADSRAKYFSIDRGATAGPGFSLGRTWGDGQQASHWKDNLGIGIMDPTAGRGELLAISANDRRGFDVIGWNLAQANAVPEPGTWMMMLMGFGLVGGTLRRRRSTQIATV
jgi:hypothetical protein